MKIKIDDDYGNIEDKDIVDDSTKENIITYESYEVQSVESEKKESEDIRGKINVISKLGNKYGTLISSSKINLYMLNGISPRLVSSKLTNEKGQVTFMNLKKGSYRVIAIVDRRFFQKPTYMEWNEVTIDEENKEETIIVINRIKR
ncbi:MAG: hypothetical protein MJ191_04565 [Clostridium sp.]|nr:hypothetical protein [Clostridium sp.]